MNHLEAIQERLNQLMEGTDCFLIASKELTGNVYKFYIDADGGFNLKTCVSFNRQLRRFVEDALWYPDGNFSIEVSSPGIDEPLTLERQFVKNIGRLVEVTFEDKEQKPLIGRIKAVTPETLLIEITDKKKKTTAEHTIDRTLIKTAVIQIEF
jgi:ribosome maturation factor RimP